MNLRYFPIKICFLLVALASAEVTAGAKTPPGTLETCAAVRAKADTWVEQSVNRLVPAARAAYDDEKGEPGYQKTLDRIVGTMRRCGLDHDEGFLARHRSFVEYLNVISLDRKPDHELGFSVPDRQYFAETKQYVGIPDFLLTTKFLRAVSRTETVDEAKAMLREMNAQRAADDQMIFFSYKSRHLGTPDNDDSFRRLLIVVPGNPAQGVPDKWVQFGVSDPGVRDRVRNVSVVSAVEHKDGTFDAYFKDYFRTYTMNGAITIKGRWELGEGDDNCVTCHKSGVLPIFPVAGSVPKDELPAVEAVNEIFRGYGSPRFGNYLDTTKFGPGLSEALVPDRAHRLGQKFLETEEGKAMDCTTCHQHSGLGSLNWPMDSTLIGSFVEDGPMPMGYALTKEEKADLYAKLIDEYFATDDAHPGILKSYLLRRN